VCACKYLLTRARRAGWRFAQQASVQIRQQALADHVADPIHARIDVQGLLSALKGLDPRFKCC
jgi:hypothetical protein